MKRNGLLVTVGFLMVLGLLTGCHMQASPDVTAMPAGSAHWFVPTATPDAVDATAMAGTAVANATLAAQAAEALVSTATPTPLPTATPVPPTATPTAGPVATAAPTGEVVHVVQPGENLFRIALRYGTTVQAIASANGIANPALIKAGQVLRIPRAGTQLTAPAGETTYVVQPGDNLFRIGLRFGMSHTYLAQYNGIANPALIYVGQVLRIPPR